VHQTWSALTLLQLLEQGQQPPLLLLVPLLLLLLPALMLHGLIRCQQGLCRVQHSTQQSHRQEQGLTAAAAAMPRLGCSKTQGMQLLWEAWQLMQLRTSALCATSRLLQPLLLLLLTL
jgi:hypothetical protein